jgi:alkylhydroperoxidase/carboxymuconolactone decarboxylase family protein YurZ
MAATATPVPFALTVVRPGFRWSRDAAQKAQAKGAFLRVGGNQVSRRFLSGAKRSWANVANPDEHDTIFHTGYRITGTPTNVRIALESAGVTADEIAQIMATAITRDNWNTTMAAQYEAEINARNALKTATPVTEGYEWPQILWFAQNLKSAVFTTKAPTTEQRAVGGSPGRRTRGETLAEKLRNLKDDKVIDVSGYDPQTGKHAKTTAKPKTAKSGKFGDFRRGVNIISNNIENYIRALQTIYGPDAEVTYAPEIEYVRNQLAGGATPFTATPGPYMGLGGLVPGATLAPAPTFAAAVPPVASPPVGAIGGTTLPPLPAFGALPTLPQ